jgi:hypothetical protein
MTKQTSDASGKVVEVEIGSAIDVEKCICTAITGCRANYAHYDVQIVGDAHTATRNWQVTNVSIRVLSREIFFNSRETLVKL